MLLFCTVIEHVLLACRLIRAVSDAARVTLRNVLPQTALFQQKARKLTLLLPVSVNKQALSNELIQVMLTSLGKSCFCAVPGKIFDQMNPTSVSGHLFANLRQMLA